MDSDTPQNLKTLEINEVLVMKCTTHSPHIAAITNISVIDGYSNVTGPLIDRYVGYTPALDILAFWAEPWPRHLDIKLDTSSTHPRQTSTDLDTIYIGHH